MGQLSCGALKAGGEFRGVLGARGNLRLHRLKQPPGLACILPGASHCSGGLPLGLGKLFGKGLKTLGEGVSLRRESRQALVRRIQLRGAFRRGLLLGSEFCVCRLKQGEALPGALLRLDHRRTGINPEPGKLLGKVLGVLGKAVPLPCKRLEPCVLAGFHPSHSG